MSTLPLVPGALCLICQDQYGADKEKGVPCSLPCGHVLCLACTERIQAETPSCPYCRIAFRRSDIHKLHVIARPFPNGPGDTETAKKLSDKIAEIAAKGIERPQLMKLINDIKSFLASEPRHTHPELRLNYRMISYLGDLKSSNISQYGALKTVADEVEGLRSDKEKLNEEMKLLKKEIRELRQEIEQNEITRKYEHETALAVEGSLREHIERSREAYATLISNYNKLLTEKDPQRQLAPLKTSWEGVALQDPDSSLISPHPLFLSPLPTTSLIRSLPDLREDDEEEEEENRVVEEDDDEDDEDDDDSVTTPDDLTSSHTIDMRDVHDSPPHSHATSALPPRVYEAPKSSLLSRTAPYADRRRPRSSSSPTLPSNPASRDRSPVKGLSGSPPAQSTNSRSSKDTRPKANPNGQELRFRLASLLDKDTPASLPNPSTGHFPSYLTSREREREPQGQREEPHSSSPPHRASSSVPKAVPPPPPSAPAPPVTHSSASPTPTDPSYLLASHPTQLGQGFISRPSSSAAPSSLPRVATSSASEQAKKMEEERRKQKEQRQAERTKQADPEAQSEREREAQKNRLTPPSSVSASQVAAAVSNPRDYPSMGMNKTPVQAGSLAPTSGSGSYAGNSSSTNLHSSSRRAVASPSIPVPPHPQALPAHIGPYGRPAGPPPMHTSDLASHPPPQYPNWHHAIPTIPSPVQAHSGNTPPRHGSYGSKGIYA